MDCIRCLDPAKKLDEQRFETLINQQNPTQTAPADAKLLWIEPLIPWRTITVLGHYIDEGILGPSFDESMNHVMANPQLWSSADVPSGFGPGQVLTVPQWGQDYSYVTPADAVTFWGLDQDLIALGVSAAENLSYLWSGWQYTTFGSLSGPIDPSTLSKIGALTQVICPSAFKPINYELWTVTTRWGIPDPQAGPPYGNVPLPFPWSMSTDFNRVKSSVLHPGETLIIPCPVGLQPQNPPGPPADISTQTVGVISGWGVSEFIVFTGPAN